jgi:transcriptional regulator with XRE-family HTH domain
LTISERIKKLRERNNLKQDGFAEKIGAKRGNVAQWEAGNNNPSLDYLTKICEVFDVTADWLLGIAEGRNEIDSPLHEMAASLKELVQEVKTISSMIQAWDIGRIPDQSRKKGKQGNASKPVSGKTLTEEKVDNQIQDTKEQLNKKRQAAKDQRGSSKEKT